MALVPWLLLVRNLPARPAFWWSWLIGFLFFLGSIWWLVYVTVVGWVVLCAYLAVYFGVFGWFVATRRNQQTWMQCLLIPTAWVALEYVRAHALSGFGWNLLAYSQTSWRPLIQFADLTGAWGVSFLIVLVNVAIMTLIGDKERLKQTIIQLVAVVVVVLAALGYGGWRLRHLEQGPTVRLAVVQGNIPQEQKWDETFTATIQQRYSALTQRAASTQPDLIVWPETSVPGYLGVDEALTQWVSGIATSVQRPMLVGAPVPWIASGRAVLGNSAVLVDERGNIRQRYDKLHLVPFGEFIPFERFAPWLRNVLPPIGDFTPGDDYTVFSTEIRNAEFGMRDKHSELRTPNSELKFSVLVCFEDVFPELARRFVQRGAQLLLVITNDAWFGPTAAAYQHVQASTFRAIELRVPIARAANTGWSGSIDATGQWRGAVHDANGRELFTEGTHTCDLPVGTIQTLYLKWGDWFAICCFLVMGLSFIRRLPYN